MVAISQAESHCRADAVGDMNLTYEQDGRTYGYSIGPLQVRMLPGREWCQEDYYECAHTIWSWQGYNGWTCYNNGAYLAYL